MSDDDCVYDSVSGFIIYDADEEFRAAEELEDPNVRQLIYSLVGERPEKIELEYRVMSDRPQNPGASMFNPSEWSPLVDSNLPTNVFIKVRDSKETREIMKKLKASIKEHYSTNYEILALKRLQTDSSGVHIEEYLDNNVLAEYPLRNKQTVIVYLLHCQKRK